MHKAFAAVAIVATTAASALAHAAEHKSAVFVLVDLSGTWHYRQADQRNLSLLRKTEQGVEQLTKRLERPIYIAYIGIEDHSITQTPICEATYHPVLLSGSKRTVLQRPQDLDAFLSTCSTAALARPTAGWTDISGAFDLMERQLGDDARGMDKYAVVLSDMKEERQTKFTVTPDLKDYKVLLAYRVLPEDDRDPAAFRQRISGWKKKLGSWGATVSTVADTGLITDSIVRLGAAK
jgi:hypothetical protein